MQAESRRLCGTYTYVPNGNVKSPYTESITGVRVMALQPRDERTRSSWPIDLT
jgi:hypothetical protein